jgi:aspartyl aminopeptidase
MRVALLLENWGQKIWRQFSTRLALPSAGFTLPSEARWCFVKKNTSLQATLLLAALLLVSGTPTLEAAPFRNKLELRSDYQAFLDRGRTPKEIIDYSLEKSTWRLIDPSKTPIEKIHPGDRLVFVNQGRTALYVIVGSEPLAQQGARIIASHIDTPSPRLLLATLTEDNQAILSAGAHGGIKGAHWLRRPLAMVGVVIKSDGTKLRVSLGSEDDFAFYIEERIKGEYKVTASSTPSGKTKTGSATSFVSMLHDRYGLGADDLRSAELYLVPKMPSRLVGVEGMMVGSHGQDDRANAYLAWRAIDSIQGTPRQTAITWLADREESGSRGRSGARSHYLELVFSYLLRAQQGSVSEATLMRALAATTALSADTPACVNPNWPEVHEKQHGPLLGRGPAMFPGTGRRGKVGGSQAHAELIASVLAEFSRAKVPVQTAELGRVDEGGGGTVAKYLAHRGIDTVDLGVCVIAMHSPFEISSVQDFWWALRGFEAWLGAR